MKIFWKLYYFDLNNLYSPTDGKYIHVVKWLDMLLLNTAPLVKITTANSKFTPEDQNTIYDILSHNKKLDAKFKYDEKQLIWFLELFGIDVKSCVNEKTGGSIQYFHKNKYLKYIKKYNFN